MNSKSQTEVNPRNFNKTSEPLSDRGFQSTFCDNNRRLLPPSGDKTGTKSSLLPVLLFLCASAVLTMVISVLFHMSGVQTELDRLRQRLDRLETKLGDIQDTGNNFPVQSREEELEKNRGLGFVAHSVTSNDLSRSFFKDEVKVDAELTLNNDGSRTRRRRFQRSADPKKKEKAKPSRVAKKESQKSTEKISAVHFHPKNSSSRTFTTRRGSPVLDIWEPSKWSKPLAKSFYHIRDGLVTILEDGIYFIYVQLVFHDLSGRWSFSVNINDRQELKCINSEHISSAHTFHPTNHGVYQHCFSSRLFHIRSLEQVSVRCLYEQLQVLVSPEFTFWGIIRMS